MYLIASFISALVFITNSHVTSGIMSKMVCEYETMNLACLENQRMDIKSVDFGRKNAVYCNTNNQWTSMVTNCTTKPASLAAVQSKCQNKRACAVPANYLVLGDPCSNVQKYLEVEYECLTGGLMSQFACDNEKLTLSCPANKRIVINEATYGRTDPIKCYRPGTIVNTNLCSAAKATQVIVNSCDYKTTCSVTPSTTLFGDPCPGISKYLEVKYSCH